MKTVSVHMRASVAALALIAAPGAAWAQQDAAVDAAASEASAATETPEADAGEIIVTAQRRSQKLQDVPLAISAFNDASLKAGKVESLVNLDGKIPNVVLAPVGAYPFASAFYIRGIGFADVESTFEPSVGVEVDGVYLARNVAAIQDFFDIESVTVLRGPQGTLYGRNTIGGVVSVRSKRPTGEFGVRAQGTVGSFGRREGRAAIEGAIVEDVLAAKLSVLGKHYGGYYKNDDGRRFGKQDVVSLRGVLAFTPSDSFDATLIADYSRDRGNGPAFENASLPTMVLPAAGYPADSDGKPFHTHVGEDQFYRLESVGATLEANWDVGFGKLTSISGYRDVQDHTLTDYDGEKVSFLNVDRDQSHHQFSQELRLASTGGGAFNYVVGLYYLNQFYDIDNRQFGTVFGAPDAGSSLFASQRSIAKAVFGQVDYKLLPGLTVTAGGRYSHDFKRFTIQPLFNPTSQTFEDKFSDFSPKFAMSYEWTPDIMTYAQYSRGYRSGGFNGRAGSFTAVGPYKSESVDSFEAGVKSQFFDRRLTLNVAAFQSKYKDMQLSALALIPNTNINESVVTNAGQATIQGVEGEASARLGGGFSINATIAYLDAGFDKFVANLGDGQGEIDRSALPLGYAPKWSGSLTGVYEADLGFGTLTVQGSARHASRIYTSFGPLNAVSDLNVRPKNTLFDANIGLELGDGRWRIGLWGKNLTDKTVINNTFAVGSLLAARLYQPPREIGVDVGFKF